MKSFHDIVEFWKPFNYDTLLSFDFDFVKRKNPVHASKLESGRVLSKLPPSYMLSLKPENLFDPDRIYYYGMYITFSYEWYGDVYVDGKGKIAYSLDSDVKIWLDDIGKEFADLNEDEILMLRTYLEILS